MSTDGRTWRPCVLRGGESLSTLAEHFGCTVRELRAHANNAWLADVPDRRAIVPGDVVYVPAHPDVKSDVSVRSGNAYAARYPRALRWVSYQDLGAVFAATGASGMSLWLALYKGAEAVSTKTLAASSEGARFDVGDLVSPDRSEPTFDAVELAAYTSPPAADSWDLPARSSVSIEPLEARVALDETWGGTRNEFRSFVMDVRDTLPPDGSIAWALVLRARTADGAPSAECDFKVTVDDKPAALKTSGDRKYAYLMPVRSGARVVIEAAATGQPHRRVKPARMTFEVYPHQRLKIVERDHDFKPPVVTNVAPVDASVDLARVDRVLCDFFLSRVEDRTRDALEIIRTGEPKKLDYGEYLIPADPAERPEDFCNPAPACGQYTADFPNLRPAVVNYPKVSSRLFVTIDPSAPAIDKAQPRLVLLTWTAHHLPFSFAGVDAAPIDKHVQVATAFGAGKLFAGATEPVDQLTFDRLWEFPFWYPNFLLPPTMVGKGAQAKPFPIHEGHVRERHPFLYTGTHWWWHSGAGVAHQISTTKRRILGIYPMSGLAPRGGDATGLSDWMSASGDEVDEFLYEMTALLRRQHGVYAMPPRKPAAGATASRPRPWKDEIGRVSLGGYSRACNDTALPLALCWSSPGHALEEHLTQVVLLDPPDGGGLIHTTSERLRRWAEARAKRSVEKRVRLFFVSRRSGFADTLLGGVPARFGRDDQGKVRDTGSYTFVEESPASKGYPAPLTFIYTPHQEWFRVFREWLRPRDPKGTLGFGGNDSHMLTIYFGLYMALARSTFGTPPPPPPPPPNAPRPAPEPQRGGVLV